MGRSTIEYVLLALLLFCVITIGIAAVATHAEKIIESFQVIGSALSMGAGVK